jgi:hypothetical protein
MAPAVLFSISAVTHSLWYASLLTHSVVLVTSLAGALVPRFFAMVGAPIQGRPGGSTPGLTLISVARSRGRDVRSGALTSTAPWLPVA